jgi:hypothetical protein
VKRFRVPVFSPLSTLFDTSVDLSQHTQNEEKMGVIINACERAHVIFYITIQEVIATF